MRINREERMAESGTPGGELESIERKGWLSLELQEVSLNL